MTWIKPSKKDLELEYRVEVVYKGLDHIEGLETFRDFKRLINKAKPIKLTKSMDRNVANRSRTKTKSQLLHLISQYGSYPKYRNEDTLDNLYYRIENGLPMNMPIIIDHDGYQQVLSGNTRLDVAFQLDVIPTVLIINVS